MRTLQRTSLQRKGDLQPSNSSESVQTAQSAQQHAASPSASPVVGSSNPSVPHALPGLFPCIDALTRPRLDPYTAKSAIKEALAPLGPAELARVQEQLRQSRLARQQQAWGGFGAVCTDVTGYTAQSCSPCCHMPSSACQHGQHDNQLASSGGPANPLVQQVASALATGQLSSQDISRVLSTLDPSVFRPLPQQQQGRQLQLPQPCWVPPPEQHNRWSSQHRPAPVMAPTAIPDDPSPFYSSQLPRVVSTAPRRGRKVPAASVAAPYSAVLSSLVLPPAALAAHAAAATAAAAAAEQRHPGSSLHKGRRGSRRPRSHLGSLMHSVSTASDALGFMSVAHPAAHPEAQQQLGLRLSQQGSFPRDMLQLLAAQAGEHTPMMGAWHAPDASAQAPAAAAAMDWPEVVDVPLAMPSSPEVAEATPAGVSTGGHTEHDEEAPAPPTSLRARFARLPAAVQEDILRQLDELAALEEAVMGGSGSGGSAPAEQEPQGPRRSGRARKVRDWENGGFTTAGGNQHRSSSPTPPPSCPPDDHHEPQQRSSHAAPKRMRLDASNTAHGSPDAPCAHHQGQGRAGASPEIDMCAPLLELELLPGPVYEPEPLPRKRRVPRKAGLRASARKRMHRTTFKRGKPQRAPVA